MRPASPLSDHQPNIPCLKRSCPTDLGEKSSVNAAEQCRSRILVVDDSIDTVRGTEILLKLLGYDVETASDGLTAIDIAGRQKPHFVLLDIGMPGIDGYEIATRLSAQGVVRKFHSGGDFRIRPRRRPATIH